MKKVLLATLIVSLLVPPPVFARGWRGYRGGAVAAGVLGGLATGILLDRLFVPLPPQPVYYPAPVYYYPWRYPYYSYPATYYEPAPVIAQVAPQVYQQPQQQYWYWCEDPRGYYPYVQECPSNWKQVVPQTSPPK